MKPFQKEQIKGSTSSEDIPGLPGFSCVDAAASLSLSSCFALSW